MSEPQETARIRTEPDTAQLRTELDNALNDLFEAGEHIRRMAGDEASVGWENTDREVVDLLVAAKEEADAEGKVRILEAVVAYYQAADRAEAFQEVIDAFEALAEHRGLLASLPAS